jgi:Ribbon-helix-helix protein, copG family
MRTTITLDNRLLERLKKRAAESGTSVSGLIERAVRLLLRASASQRRGRFDLVTFGEGGQFTTLNIDKTAALLEADDVERFGRQR